MADMKLNRRIFLQQAGLALLTLGITETGIYERSPGLDSYLQALGQTTNRKLALLVGINDYSQHYHLDGCVTDVELQRELLINRFGFNPKDIVVITNQQATRENIETAFVEHLQEQVQPGDVVVFHFSGYGSRVKLPLSETVELKQGLDPGTYELVDSLIPIDGIVPTKGTPVANDLLKETLIWLARSLATEKITMVLDTSFSNTQDLRRGNLRVRSFNEIAERPSPEEVAFREQLQIKLAGKFGKASHPGVILAAASQDEIAVEKRWNSFSAGLFTYALTQYLWQVTSPTRIQIALQRSTETIKTFMGKQQQPAIVGGAKPLFPYYLMPSNSVGAEGIVKAVDNKGSISLQLTGLPAQLVDYYGVNSCFKLVPSELSIPSAPISPSETTLLQVRSREGLTAKAQLVHRDSETDNVESGQLIQEYIRVLSRNLGLVVGLERNLSRIERVDATSAFANVPTVATVVSNEEANVDCLLGKIKKTLTKEIADSSDFESTEVETPPPSYGLFSTGGVAIPHTTGTANEAVKSAVIRLKPQLNNLLAAKWLELTVNQGSSCLPVGATLELVNKNNGSPLIQKATRASESLNQISTKDNFSSSSVDFATIEPGSQLRLQLTNYSDRNLYVMVLGSNSDSSIFVMRSSLNTNGGEFEPKDLAIAPKEQITLPNQKDAWQWKFSDPANTVTIYPIFSIAPFQKTIALLAAQPNLPLEREQILNLTNPVEVARSLLLDLHTASAMKTDAIGSVTDVYALNVNNWATLKLIWELANQ